MPPTMPITLEMGGPIVPVVELSKRNPNPDIDRKINDLKIVLLQNPEGSDPYLDAMELMAQLYDASFALPPHQLMDRDEAIDLRRELSRVCPKGSTRQLEALYRLATALQARSFPDRLIDGYIVDKPGSNRQSYTKDDLDEIIATQKAALAICDPNHELYALLTGQLGSSMLLRRNSVSELQHALLLLRSACVLWAEGDGRRVPVLRNLAAALTALVGASEVTGAIAEMLELVDVHRDLGNLFPQTSSTRLQSLSEMARILGRLCAPPANRLDLLPNLRGTADEISRVSDGDGIEYRAIADTLESDAEVLFPRKALNPSEQLPYFDHIPRTNHPTADGVASQSSSRFVLQYLYTPDPLLRLDDIDREIWSSLDYLLQSHPLPDTIARSSYINIGALCRYRYVNSKEKRDLDAAIEYQQAAWRMTDPHDDRFRMLTRNLEDAYRERYYTSNDIEDYKRGFKLGIWPVENKPVVMGPQLLPTPMGDLPPIPPRRLESRAEQRDFMIDYYRDEISKLSSPGAGFYNDLAWRLFEKFTATWPANLAGLPEILRLLDKIDEVGSPSAVTPTRAQVYSAWYRRTGDQQYLARAVEHLPTGTIADRMQVLWERYIRTGNIADLDNAITVGRQRSTTFSLGSGDQGYYQTPLALCLHTRYSHEGNPDDTEEIIALPHAPSVDLAEAYLLRYERYGRIEDLDYAFRTGEFDVDPDEFAAEPDDEELYDDPSGDDIYASIQRTIVYCRTLLARYRLDGTTGLLRLAQMLLSRAETHCPYTLQASVLHCKASLLIAQTPSVTHLNDAIATATTALQFIAETDVRLPILKALLGSAYRTRYELTGEKDDVDSSIKALRECFARISPVNPHWAQYQVALGQSLECVFKVKSDASLAREAIVAYRDAAEASAASLRIRYNGALSWARMADARHDEDALLAYNTVMDILPQFASLELDVRDRHQSLIRSGASGIASDAAACAIRYNDLPKAVEFLEHGRSVFWRQAMQLRSPMAKLEENEPELARRLVEVARDLNISSFYTRTEEDSNAREAFIIREGPKRRALVEEWERLLGDARRVEGCEDLLQLPPYHQLAQAASSSSIVLLAHTEQSGYAIVIESRDVSPKYLPLPSATSGRVSEWVNRLRITLKEAHRGARGAVSDLQDRYSGPPRRRKVQHEEAALVRLLSVIWRDVVQPVLDFMGLTKELPQDLPRITWCPTGALALLPIHAAGIYHDDISGPCASDYIISSYTPTLSNLLAASATPSTGSPVNVLLVGLADAPGHPPIPNVNLELKKIDAVVHPASQTCCLQSSSATRVAVLSEMAKSHITHLACHGVASPNPLSSAIVLHDGDLPVSSLMRTPFANAKLVFLSACQTARLNASEPDESINIASAMLSAGFQTAIATMWSISDGDAPRIAELFYRDMLKGNSVDFGGAARALHRAVRACQESKMSPLQWAAFIHVGL